uniref:Uncharacterized protein n=1 Tax=Serratia phage Spe5P4 TaxID=3159438 RepID=A0AAU7VH87_9CAUD
MYYIGACFEEQAIVNSIRCLPRLYLFADATLCFLLPPKKRKVKLKYIAQPLSLDAAGFLCFILGYFLLFIIYIQF